MPLKYFGVIFTLLSLLGESMAKLKLMEKFPLIEGCENFSQMLMHKNVSVLFPVGQPAY